MDNLDFLYRRYREITIRPYDDWDSATYRELRAWVRDEVLPAIHGLVKRSSFQEQATWTLNTLVKNENSPERLLLNQVDFLLVELAKKLLAPLKSNELRTKLGDKATGKRVASERAQLDGGPRPKVLAREIVEFDRITEQTSSVERIAKRFWQVLVSELDYFEPLAGWVSAKQPTIQPGEFVVSLTPELHQGGDYISRCAIRRIEVLTRTLTKAISLIRLGEGPVRGRASKKASEITEVVLELRAKSRLLRHALLEREEQLLRDACILLTQIGAAANFETDLSWLAVPESAKKTVDSIKYRLFEQEKNEIFDRIAIALSRLRDHYAGQDKTVLTWDEAKSTKGLAINKSSREVSWAGLPVLVGWAEVPKEFRLLLRLAESAKRETYVSDRDPELYPEPPSPSTLATLKGRLAKRLPPSLRKLIVPAGETRSLKLKLTRKEITIVG